MTDKDQFPSPDTWYGHFVSYGETDAMGVVYYGEYLHLFERARSQFIRERGMSYARVEEKGIFLPVREACCRFRTPLRYDQHIWVRCAISHWGRASMRFAYEVRTSDRKDVAATGETEHACVNPAGRPVRVPDWLKELFGK